MKIRVLVYGKDMRVVYRIPVGSYNEARAVGARAMARGAYAWEVRTGAPFKFIRKGV